MRFIELYESSLNAKDNVLENTINACKEITKLMEVSYEGGIDWVPQPDVAGKGGVTTSTGYGQQHAASSQKKQEAVKLQQAYKKLKLQMSRMSDEQKIRMKPHMDKLLQVAKSKGIDLEDKNLII